MIATFASDGPEMCSNLDVRRYDENGLCDEFGDNFVLVTSLREEHRTPWNSAQMFVYCVFKRL